MPPALTACTPPLLRVVPLATPPEYTPTVPFETALAPSNTPPCKTYADPLPLRETPAAELAKVVMPAGG